MARLVRLKATRDCRRDHRQESDPLSNLILMEPLKVNDRLYETATKETMTVTDIKVLGEIGVQWARVVYGEREVEGQAVPTSFIEPCVTDESDTTLQVGKWGAPNRAYWLM
jgi:hypothetical protein